MERKELAIQLYKKGYSCAQAVACAYHASLLLSEDAAYRISEGFGGGMGHYGHTCGACSAMVMVAGSQISKGIEDMSSKQQTYPIVKEMVEQFVEANGYLNCFDILRNGSQDMEDNKRVCCIHCIHSACDILDHMLKK